jgi:hypothetical protein
VHPTHTVRPVGCWGPKDVPIAVEQSSGRDRLNIHGAIDLETGQTAMKDVLTVDAISTIMLLTAIEAMYPGMRFVHVFLDNARYHHARLVQAWLARQECRIRLNFVPADCPHLNSIERLWGLMHRHITHTKCYATFREFSTAMLAFPREDVPKNSLWLDEKRGSRHCHNSVSGLHEPIGEAIGLALDRGIEHLDRVRIILVREHGAFRVQYEAGRLHLLANGCRLNPMQRLGVARALPDRGGVVYDDVAPTGLQPLVDSAIEVSRRRALGLDQRGVKIVVEQVKPYDIRWLRYLRRRHEVSWSAETASTFSRPGSFASVRMRPTGSFLKWATSAGTKL